SHGHADRRSQARPAPRARGARRRRRCLVRARRAAGVRVGRSHALPSARRLHRVPDLRRAGVGRGAAGEPRRHAVRGAPRRYRAPVNLVLGLEVVLPDGEIVWLGGRTRDALGYDLAGVFVGSEGTFGIATKIVVRILRKPQAVKTVLAVFDRIEQASAAVSAIIARGLVPAAVEMIDQLTIQAVEDAFGCGYPRDAAAALLIELDGLAVAMETQAERIVAACRDAGAREVRTAASEAERQLLWKGRKSAFGAYGRVSPACMVMDGVIPRTKLPYVLRRVNEIVAASGLRVGNVFHAGDGNLHPNILYDPRKPGEEARAV